MNEVTTDRVKYKVFKANIMDEDGNKILAGETVELGPKLAKRYNKLGFLKPFIDDDDEDDDDEPVARTKRSPARV